MNGIKEILIVSLGFSVSFQFPAPVCAVSVFVVFAYCTLREE